MMRKYVGLALGAVIAVGAALSLPSCGHDQKLVNIAVTPFPGFTFLTPDTSLQTQYTAIGTYIHPPATKDITKQVTWKVDFAGLVTLSNGTPGLVSPAGQNCGVADISATASEGTGGAGNIVIGYSTVTVDNPAVKTCPGGGTSASLIVGIQGNGTVTSSPAGISCPSTCGATFDVNSSVLLTAAPATGLSTTWGNCTTFTGNLCTVTIPTGGTTVTATFK